LTPNTLTVVSNTTTCNLERLQFFRAFGLTIVQLIDGPTL
jgi:hypothetical protein